MRPGPRLKGTVVVTLAAFAVSAPSALAHQNWYAAPHSQAGATCAKSNPCALQHALNSAQNGDPVIVGPGDYGTPSAPVIGGYGSSSNISCTVCAASRGRDYSYPSRQIPVAPRSTSGERAQG